MSAWSAIGKLPRKERIAQKTGGITRPRADERIVTLSWFARNRFFPLRERQHLEGRDRLHTQVRNRNRYSG